MSVDALTWVFKATIKPATHKLVMLALADYANEHDRCYPSIATVVQRTSLDRKTVIKTLAGLKQSGLIEDTGERTGHTKQIPIWKLTYAKQSQKRNSPKNGTVPKTEQSQISHETVPKLGHGSVREPLVKDGSPNGDPITPVSQTREKPPAKKKRSVRLKTYMPEELEAQEVLKASVLTDTMRAWAAKKGLVIDWEEQWEAFVRKALAKGYQNISWYAAFQNWLTSPYQEVTPYRNGAPYAPLDLKAAARRLEATQNGREVHHDAAR